MALTTEEYLRVKQMHADGAGWVEMAMMFQRGSVEAFRAEYRRAAEIASRGILNIEQVAAQQPDPCRTSGVTIADDGDGRSVESNGDRIKTLDDLLAAAEVDLGRWEVERFVVNKWEVGARRGDEIVVEPLWQVKAWLKPLPGVDAVAAVIADMKADALAWEPPPRTPVRRVEWTDHMLELCIMDPHFGQLSWHEETGEDYDSDIAEAIAADVVDQVVRIAVNFGVARVLFPIGNDWLHADVTVGGKGGATTRGTHQDVDTRWQKMFRTGRRVATTAIDRLLELAPVDAPIVPGNHDTERMFFLGDSLEAWYRRCDEVAIDNSPRPRKYREFGVNLIGLAHGHNEKHGDLPLIMATEAPEMWARTAYRHWHLGHQHRAKTVNKQVLEDKMGVQVRVFASMAANDSWAAQQGYRHHRQATALVWHREQGLVAEYHINTDPRTTSKLHSRE